MPSLGDVGVQYGNNKGVMLQHLRHLLSSISHMRPAMYCSLCIPALVLLPSAVAPPRPPHPPLHRRRKSSCKVAVIGRSIRGVLEETGEHGGDKTNGHVNFNSPSGGNGSVLYSPAGDKSLQRYRSHIP